MPSNTSQLSPSTSIHTIIGAGQVGCQLARQLAARGHQVRLVRRSPSGPPMPGVTWLQGDVLERSFADEACQGASVVYNTAHPTDYAKWDGVLQPLFRAVWAAAARAGARLVQLDNLYMVGKPDVSPFSESIPLRPCSDKGRLRHELASELLDMHARGVLEVSIGRASDYFGPATPNAAVLRPDVLDAIRKGGVAYVFGNPDMPHGYTYTPDVARALAILGQDGRALGRAWHLPTSAKLTTRELLERFAAQAGTRVRVRGVPVWALRAVGLVSPLMAALADTTYQFEIPYVLDDTDFCRTFGMHATPLEQAISETLRGEQAQAA